MTFINSYISSTSRKRYHHCADPNTPSYLVILPDNPIMDDQPTQITDISALPIDQQMEHILRTKLDVQELVSPSSSGSSA